MSLRLGRVGPLPEPTNWASTTSRLVTVTGSYQASSVTDGLVKRDQLLSMADNWDEPIIPVVMDNEPRVTGYYRVLGASVPTDEFVRLKGNLYDYQVDLERVMGFANPLMESIMSGALMTNAVGGLVGDMVQFHAFPGTTEEYYRGAIVSTTTRASADGNMSFSLNGTISTSASFSLHPTDFYVGAATFEQGNPLRPVVGRLYQDDAVNWRLSNGLVRFVPTDLVSSPFKFSVSHWTSGTWGTPKQYQLVQAAGAAWLGALQSVTVLRNSVEETTIRLAFTPTSGLKYLLGRIFVDVSLRRGDRLVRMVCNSDIVSVKPQLRLNTPEAGTAIAFGGVAGGGLRASSNDGDGNRYVLLSYQTATTVDAANGRLTQTTAAASCDFAVGCEIGGSGASGTDTAASLGGQYLAAQAEAQRVVSR